MGLVVVLTTDAAASVSAAEFAHLMPSAIESLRKQLRDKRTTLDSLADPINEQNESREQTPAEAEQFTALIGECNTLKGRITALEALGDAPAAANGPDQRSLPPQAPAIHTDDSREPYSILRAIRSRVDGVPLSGLEREVEAEIRVRTGKTPKGILIPTGADSNIREMLRYGQPERRDLTTLTGGGSIFTVPRLPVIDLLRAKLVLAKLGADFIPDVQGNFAMPRQSGTTTTYFVGEGVPTSLSNPSFDMIPFTPRVAITATQVSREYIDQTSINFEEAVKNDLAQQMARTLEYVALNGTGGTQPLGLLQNPNVPVLPIGANGGYPTWGTVVGLESQVANANADQNKLGYLTCPRVRGALKMTSKTTAGYPTFVWEDGAEPGEGLLNSYRALTTTNVPENLAKGAGTNLSALIYGNWNDLVIAMWEGIDMLINPYSGQLTGSIIISNHYSIDIQVRRPQSFAIANDVQYQG